MKTETIVKALALARPCLGGANTVLPILSHFCFEGDSFYAYDDTVAVDVSLKTGLKRAVHGDTLSALLEAAGVDKIEIKQAEGDVVQLKAGGGWVKLPSLSVKDLGQFSPPDEEPVLSLPIDDELCGALEAVLLSVGLDSGNPAFAGVTLSVAGGAATLYSTNNSTASRVKLSAKVPKKAAVDVVIPSRACEHILRLKTAVVGEEGTPLGGQLDIGTRGILGFFGEDVRLFTKVLEADVKSVAQILKAHADVDGYVDIPEGLAGEVAKASVILGSDAVKKAQVSFAQGEVRISASGALGQMESTVKCGGKLKGTVVIDPALVSRVLGRVSKWRVNDGKSLAFSSDGFHYVISSAN